MNQVKMPANVKLEMAAAADITPFGLRQATAFRGSRWWVMQGSNLRPAD
jgi:hypothetical protein